MIEFTGINLLYGQVGLHTLFLLCSFIDQHIVTVGLYAYAYANFYTVLKQKENIRNSEQKSRIFVGVVLNLC